MQNLAGGVNKACSAADDPMPSLGAAIQQAPAPQVPPQQQLVDNSTVIPDPVQQQGMASQTIIQERAQGLRAVPMSRQPIQPGQPLGTSVLAPCLQPLIATPYSAASGRKVCRQCSHR